ncbi:archaemetzincin family Zn-dependent metalloprotease [Methanobacterium sp.]|uniref:archaemetzincin family Zn-dependent metalloprotease n=1 Tax=Methanobacterium sp. TaxID=2164 RepID=UPI003C7844E3
MEIFIQSIGTVEKKLLKELAKPLEEIFGIKCSVSNDILEIPERAYNPSRDQYHSTEILYSMMNILKVGSNHIIGITEVDLYASRLNFVLGEAEYPGHFAIISLHRLKSPNKKLFLKRVLTEAVHELGHTFGLPHCGNHLCVMHFSNSVVETDIKGPGFCSDCLSNLFNQ